MIKIAICDDDEAFTSEIESLLDSISKSVYIEMEKLNKLYKIREKYIRFVFRNFALISRFTGYENVELPLLVRNIPYKKRKKIVCEKQKLLGCRSYNS